MNLTQREKNFISWLDRHPQRETFLYRFAWVIITPFILFVGLGFVSLGLQARNPAFILTGAFILAGAACYGMAIRQAAFYRSLIKKLADETIRVEQGNRS